MNEVGMTEKKIVGCLQESFIHNRRCRRRRACAGASRVALGRTLAPRRRRAFARSFSLARLIGPPAARHGAACAARTRQRAAAGARLSIRAAPPA